MYFGGQTIIYYNTLFTGYGIERETRGKKLTLVFTKAVEGLGTI